MEKPSQPIDLAIALTQHEAYVQLLQALVISVIEVPPSDAFPDCCFIEDTIEFFRPNVDSSRRLIVLNKLGAPSRQGEEQAVLANLKPLAETRPSLEIIDLKKGTVDGGDILFVGDAVLIGQSTRTNKDGFEALKEALLTLDLPAFPIPVPSGLHLKSCCSLIDTNVIVIADNEEGRHVRAAIESLPITFDYVVVPDGPASNVLRIDDHIVIQDGFPNSEPTLLAFAETRGLQVHKLTMSEFIKADGALTCCSVLLNV